MSQIDVNRGINTGRGFAEVTAHFYPSGQLIVETHAHCTDPIHGLFTRGYVVGKDTNGAIFFITPEFNLPTACSTADWTCPSDVRGNQPFQFPSVLGKYIAGLDIYIYNKDDPSSWSLLIKNTKAGVEGLQGVYKELPSEVQTVILVSLGSVVG